ncbi:hypothetical protein DY000_02010432 [Brassica cretica]|uniref:Uncharacterized protein n=1 Tax=Brassica cretica TaxID=69181 RepID=A0ABQ7BQR7_BRACR|nr:hypothetical protein DY000_02010432 [Brassica cretica]
MVTVCECLRQCWFGIDPEVHALSKQHGREITGGPWPTWKLVPQEKKDSWWQSFIISVPFPFLPRKRRDCLRKRHRKQPRYINPKDWETILVKWSTYEAKSKSQSAAISRTSAPEGKEMHKHGQDHRLLPILSIIIDEEALVMETEQVVEEMMAQDGSPVGESQMCSTSGTTTSKCLLLNQEYIKRGQTRKGETFYELGSVQFRTTTTSQFVPALLKRSLDMEMRLCGIETTTDEVKADLNAFKSDFNEEMAAKTSTLNMILQVLQLQASVPPASTTQATQPHPDRQAQAPSPAHDKSQTQGQSQRQHLITNNQADLDKWCRAEFGL